MPRVTSVSSSYPGERSFQNTKDGSQRPETHGEFIHTSTVCVFVSLIGHFLHQPNLFFHDAGRRIITPLESLALHDIVDITLPNRYVIYIFWSDDEWDLSSINTATKSPRSIAAGPRRIIPDAVTNKPRPLAAPAAASEKVSAVPLRASVARLSPVRNVSVVVIVGSTAVGEPFSDIDPVSRTLWLGDSPSSLEKPGLPLKSNASFAKVHDSLLLNKDAAKSAQ
jgi:hypothetical protein